MHRQSDFKAGLQAGRAAVGCFLHLASSQVAEIVCSAGYDCVMIDREHGAAGLMEAIGMLQAAESAGVPALMRVPENSPAELKRSLDLGLAGVMIPMIDDVAAAEDAVRNCRYPPRGRRGLAARVIRASGYGTRLVDYMAGLDRDFLVICQIESRAGVVNAASIAAVDGVDMIFVGPHDLSANLGHMGKPDHPEVRQAIAAVEAAARQAGKLIGALTTPKRPAAELLRDRCALVLGTSDISLLRDAACADVAQAKAGLTR